MFRRPPRPTRTDTLFPYPTLFRSDAFAELLGGEGEPSLRVVQLASNFLDRHGEPDRADELRDGYRSAHPQSATLMPGALKRGATDAAGEPPEPLVRNARDGIAEILFHLAGIYYDAREVAMALVHERLAAGRAEERRVGTEWDGKCGSRWVAHQ